MSKLVPSDSYREGEEGGGRRGSQAAMTLKGRTGAKPRASSGLAKAEASI
jgi:hypothetical protein